jgi:hypothetical protein
MIKKSNIELVEGQTLNKELDINAFIKALQIPNINELMWYTFEAAKVKYKDEISSLDDPLTIDDDDDGKIIPLNQSDYYTPPTSEKKLIPLNRNEYYSSSTSEKLKQFFRQVLANPDLQRAVLEDYYCVYKPILKLDDRFDFTDESVAISS